MADITMCKDDTCPMAKDCYRHNAKANPFWQSWFVDSPRKGDECSEFIEPRKTEGHSQGHSE